MKTLRFYKEEDNRWYVDLPTWTGSKAELEMVMGADTMLNYMAGDKDEVLINVSLSSFDNSDCLRYKYMAIDMGNGAYYKMDTYDGIDINLDMWLCNVTRFVFGFFPKKIYISKLK